jgi:hypothetical protein
MQDEGYDPSYPRRTPPAQFMKSDAQAPESADASAGEPVPLTAPPPIEAEVASAGQTGEPIMIVPHKTNDEAEAPAKPRYAKLTGELDKKILDPLEIRFWEAKKGDELRDVLARWSAEAGVDLFWGDVPSYKLPENIQLHGTFPDAVTEALTADDGESLAGRLHPNLPYGPSVLIVDRPG